MSDTATATNSQDPPVATEPAEVESTSESTPEVTPEPETPLAQDLSFLSELEEELEDIDPPQEPVQEPEPTSVVEPTPAEPKEPEGEITPPVEATPSTAAEPVQPPAEPVVEPPATVEPVPQLTQEQLTEQYTKWRTETEGLLATQNYAIDEQMAEDLNENMGEVIPKLMAKVHLSAVTAAIGHMMTTLPQAVEKALQVREANKTSEDTFYNTWPQLDRVKHHETIVRLGMAYRHVDPNASLETFVKNVGAQAMVALKIPTEAPAVVPQAPAPAPFQPAAASPPVGGPAVKENVFSQLDREFDEEDADMA